MSFRCELRSNTLKLPPMQWSVTGGIINSLPAGNGLKVLEFDASTDKPYDKHKRPAGSIEGCLIRCTVETSTETALVDWYAYNRIHDVSFVFYQKDGYQTLRQWHLEQAMLIGYREEYSSLGDAPFLVHLLITPFNIKVQGTETVDFIKLWPAGKTKS